MDVTDCFPRLTVKIVMAACGEASCMAFATKLSEKETQLELCTELSEAFNKLEALLTCSEISIGTMINNNHRWG